MKPTKTKQTCGADQSTPSHSEYFTWLNNTNEGSNEEQTLANLNFFAYLQKEYGMTLDIYAWDAGNLDGAKKTYADFSKGKLKKQYPNGYKPIVDFAKSIDTRMGVWGGTDGYGDTLNEEEARRNLLVGLCKDFDFALFKFDRVCGKLRPKKRPAFAKTMQECRKYSPDLVVLLHRNKVGDEDIYATTDLWQWVETYVDGNSYNSITAPHHRAFTFMRGLTPNLDRLKEDHGVCISSFPDYFEDDMIIQAFGRCLILAPEIYGNPFFIRDDEYPVLARIFNLHRQYKDILINGLTLPEQYGKYAVSRGDDKRRFIVTSNPTWQTKKYIFTMNEELGLKKADSFTIISRFPTEGVIKAFKWGETIEIEIRPFRASLIEIVRSDLTELSLKGCRYLTLHETNGLPDKVKIVSSSGQIEKVVGTTSQKILSTEIFDNTEVAPKYLGSLKPTPIPAFDRKLYETAMYSVCNDSMEVQAIRRSGDTQIPEVKKTRDLFFNQDTYVYRGTESKAMFDGNKDTYFESQMSPFMKKVRIKNGCLRVDIGKVVKATSVEIEYFNPDKNYKTQTPKNVFRRTGEYSADLNVWKKSKLKSNKAIEKATSKLVVKNVNNVIDIKGKIKKAVFSVDGDIRYFSLPSPMKRIHSFKVFYGEKSIDLSVATANNLMAPYKYKKTKSCQSATIGLPNDVKNTFLAIAVNGRHGKEGVYCAVECQGKTYGMTDRAPAYPVNRWQHEVVATDKNNTYYMDIPLELSGKEINVFALFNRLNISIDSIDVYICPKHLALEGIILSEF